MTENEMDCPICYDKFVSIEEEDDDEEEEEETRESSKRKRDDEERDHDNDSHANKKAKNENAKIATGASTASTISTTPLSSSATDQEPSENENNGVTGTKRTKSVTVNPSDYPHVPVELTCGHIFGQSCLAEWFKTSSSCPLCRSKLPTIGGGGSTQTTITLPNLANVIRNGREVIDDFNNRHLSITTPDETNQEGNASGQQAFENNDNASTLFVNNTEGLGMGLGMGITSLENDNINAATATATTTTSTNNNSNNTTNNNSNENNDNGPNGLDALASILRDVYNTVAERFGIARPESEENANNVEPNNDVMEIRFGRNDTGIHPIRTNRPVSGFRFYRNVNRDRVSGPPPSGGLFPSGVVSSRSRSGGPIETHELHDEEDLTGNRDNNGIDEQSQE